MNWRHVAIPSLISPTDDCGWLTPSPGRFTPVKFIRFPLYMRLDGTSVQGRSVTAVLTVFLVCFFYLCNRKQRWLVCWINSGKRLKAADRFFDWLHKYFVSAFTLRTSIIQKPNAELKAHKTFQNKTVSNYSSRTVSSTSKVYVCCVRSVAFW